MKNKKKLIFSFSCLMLAGLTLYFFNSTKPQQISSKDLKANSQKEKSSVKDKPKKSNAKLAQEANKNKKAPSKQAHRRPAAVLPQKTYVHMKTSNRYDKNWKEKALKNLKRNLNDQYQVEIQHKKQNILRHGLDKKLIEEVMVIVTHKSGMKSRYTALINSETGAIIDTMQKTEFEDRDFYKQNLKVTNNTLDLVPLNKAK
jgi:hypothetical protein